MIAIDEEAIVYCPPPDGTPVWIKIPEGVEADEDYAVDEVLAALGWSRDEVEIESFGIRDPDGVTIRRGDDEVWCGVYDELSMIREGLAGGGDEAYRALDANTAHAIVLDDILDGSIDPETGERPPYDGPPIVEPEWSIQMWHRRVSRDQMPADIVTADHYYGDGEPFGVIDGAVVYPDRPTALAECDRINAANIFPGREAFVSPRFDFMMNK